jgi:hypothetical protein
VARLRRAFGRLPAPESHLFAGPRHRREQWRTAKPARRAEGRKPGVKRRNQEKWPVEPADPASPVGRGVGNRQDTSCSTGGHAAPSPSTEAREGLSWLAVLRLFTPGRSVRSELAGRLPHRYGCIARRRAPIGNTSRQDMGRTVAGLRRDDEPDRSSPVDVEAFPRRTSCKQYPASFPGVRSGT